MNINIIIFGMIALGITNLYFTKTLQLHMKPGMASNAAYTFINACFACIYFSFINKFQIAINFPTLIFAVVSALIILFDLVLQLHLLRISTITSLSISKNSGSVITTTLFGIIVLQEKFTLFLILQLVLLMLAIIISTKKGGNTASEALHAGPLLFIKFLSSGMNTIVMKLYTNHPLVCDNISYFFLTNLTMIIFSSIGILYSSDKWKSFKNFGLKNTLNVGICTAVSNLSSILSMSLISKIPLTGYTIFTSGLTIINAVIVSVLFFKEHINKRMILAVILSLVAIILGSL